MTNAANVSSGRILSEGVAVFRRNWRFVLLAGAFEGVLAFGQRIVDYQRWGGLWGILLVGLCAVLAEIAVKGAIARIILVREGIGEADVPANAGAYLGVSIFLLVAVPLGIVLFIVPGVVLALRWCLAANFTLARQMSIRQALRASRDGTAGHRGEIFGAFVVFGLAIYGPALLLTPLAGGLRSLGSIDPLSALGAIRAVWSALAGAASLTLTTGLFAAFVGRHRALHEVFA